MDIKHVYPAVQSGLAGKVGTVNIPAASGCGPKDFWRSMGATSRVLVKELRVWDLVVGPTIPSR